MQPNYMQPTTIPAACGADACGAIDHFIRSSRQPVLLDPGDDPLPITANTFALSTRGTTVTIECWSESKNLVRRVRGIHSARRGRLELEIERFGGRSGTLTLFDLANPSNRDTARRGARLKYRERFRRSLNRQFPGWHIAELSTEPDLHHSLSPSFPRALLRRGTSGIAAIGAAEDTLTPHNALSFGLIWLDYLRQREKKLAIETLAIFMPVGFETTTCHRVRHLNPQAARYAVFIHNENDEAPVNPLNYTNLETRLNSNAADHKNPFYTRHPEAWLESQVRANIEQLDATLLPHPIYGQVPQMAGRERGIIDLLAIDCDNRLNIIEIKASQDIHLLLQALDYWMRVKWHLDRNEFSTQGYFPQIQLTQAPPKLLLVAPALEFHPSNETILRYFSPEVPVERIGIGLEWRRDFKVMFRFPSAARAQHGPYQPDQARTLEFKPERSSRRC